jgi:hypothetical protein
MVMLFELSLVVLKEVMEPLPARGIYLNSDDAANV